MYLILQQGLRFTAYVPPTHTHHSFFNVRKQYLGIEQLPLTALASSVAMEWAICSSRDQLSQVVNWYFCSMMRYSDLEAPGLCSNCSFCSIDGKRKTCNSLIAATSLLVVNVRANFFVRFVFSFYLTLCSAPLLRKHVLSKNWSPRQRKIYSCKQSRLWTYKVAAFLPDDQLTNNVTFYFSPLVHESWTSVTNPASSLTIGFKATRMAWYVS